MKAGHDWNRISSCTSNAVVSECGCVRMCVCLCVCQYVLSVGATQLSAGASSRALCSRVYANSPVCSSFSSLAVESVCAADTGGEITTGGGFSNIWPLPPFQRPHVHGYLHHHRHLLPTQPDFFNHSTITHCTCEWRRVRRSDGRLADSFVWLSVCAGSQVVAPIPT